MKIGFAPFFEEFTGADRQREKRWMGTDPTEPIFGVGVIRFPPVHNAVNEAAVGIFNILGEAVGSVEVIVPKIDERTEKFLNGGREANVLKSGVEAAVDFRNGQGTRAWVGTEMRGFFSVKEPFEIVKESSGTHRG